MLLICAFWMWKCSLKFMIMIITIFYRVDVIACCLLWKLSYFCADVRGELGKRGGVGKLIPFYIQELRKVPRKFLENFLMILGSFLENSWEIPKRFLADFFERFLTDSLRFLKDFLEDSRKFSWVSWGFPSRFPLWFLKILEDFPQIFPSFLSKLSIFSHEILRKI